MKYLTLAIANLKRQKGSFIGILALIFIASIAISTLIIVYVNSNSYQRNELERLNFGDYAAWCYDTENIDKLLQQIENVDGVDTVAAQKLVYAKTVINGVEVEHEVQLFGFNQEKYAYKIFNENLNGYLENQTLLPGEIYISPFLSSTYNSKIGDNFSVKISETETKDFTIKGYFEDSIMGSSIIGMKSSLICEEDLSELQKAITSTDTKAISAKGFLLHVNKAADSTISIADLQIKLGEQTDLNRYTDFGYSKDTMLGFLLMMQNILTGFLLLFVVILLVVAVIVIGHSISTTIEQDYVNMGILKALGFTSMQLRAVHLLQYGVVIIIGMILSIPFALLSAELVLSINVNMSSLLVPTYFPDSLCEKALEILLLLLLLYVWIKIIKISKITPISAIRGGTGEIYFKNRISVTIQKKCLNFWLGLRQLLSGKKQYIGTCLITALFVFMLTLVGRISAWIGPNGEGVMNAFGSISYDNRTYDFGLLCKNDDDLRRAEDIISSYSDTEFTYDYASTYTYLNGMRYITGLISVPEYCNMIEGKPCLYDNEILITEIVAEELGIKIGDTVTVSLNDISAEYIISGYNQCANDMGENYMMNPQGFARLNQEIKLYKNYFISDRAQLENIYSALENEFGENISIDKNVWSGSDNIALAVHLLTYLMYVIAVVFIIVVVLLTGGKILFRERNNLGIYKALGFTSSSLRISFAVRFGVISVIGSVIGIVLSAVITDPLATMLLKFSGISKFVSEIDIISTITPAIFVTVLYVIIAYLLSKSVKKIQPTILMTE